jgi:biofilm PGA synthesis N-glycosyltransferase PgaC
MFSNELVRAIQSFCFGYPFIMAWYWMAGGILYRWLKERHQPPPGDPPQLSSYPPVSVLVPCHNEAANAAEVFTALSALHYPNYEVIAINDGSRDNTGKILNDLARRIECMRVVHLAQNQGKAVALNCGAMLARNEILVCIDGDAILDVHALTWIVQRLLADGSIGGVTGNPRIRNRSTVLARLQVGEYGTIVGLIKRAQSLTGWIFTVSGVICAFRKRALQDAGWWSARTVTDDVELTWRVQLSGWRVTYVANAMCWILMPETLRGLWRQRLRWSEGGTQTVLTSTLAMLRLQCWRGWIVWLNYITSVLWSFTILTAITLWLLERAGLPLHTGFPTVSMLPAWWGAVLTMTYLLQATVGLTLERRFEKGLFRTLLWLGWYPVFFWMLQAATAVTALPKAIVRMYKPQGRWVSPDRGLA